MGNPPLERLSDGQYPHISQQKVIVSHVICEILMQYEKVCSLTLNYCTLIVWNNMVLLVHKESKSINEFIKFCSELGELLANLSIA
jgi:hypothetical protein